MSDIDKRLSHINLNNIAILLCTLFFGIAFTIYDPIWPFIVKESGIDPSQYGSVVFIAQVMEFISRWVASGYLSSAISFILGPLSISFSLGILLYSISPLTIYASLSSARVGRSLHFLGRGQIISRLFRRRGTAFSIFRVASQIGMVIGPVIGYLILSTYSREGVFLSGLLLGILAVAIFLPIYRRFYVGVRKGLLFWRRGLNREVKVMTGLTVLNNFARQAFIPFHFIVAPYLFNVGPEYITLAASIERGLSLISGVPIGWLSDRISDKRIILALSEFMLSIGILFYIFPYLGATGFILSTFFIGLAMASYAPIVAALVSESSPENPEDAVAFLLTMISLSRLPAPLAIGFIMTILGYDKAFTLPLTCLLIVGLYFILEYLSKRFR